MLKIDTYSQGLMSLKQMVVSQSSVVKGHTERLGLSFAISVMGATVGILGSPIKAEAWTCSQTCSHLKPPNDSCSAECASWQLCERACTFECVARCVP